MRGKREIFLQALAILFAARVIAVASWNTLVVRNTATLQRVVLKVEVKDFTPSAEEKIFLKKYLKSRISKIVFVAKEPKGPEKNKLKILLQDRKTSVLDLLKQGHREWEATSR